MEERVAILEDREDDFCSKDELSSTVKSIQVDLAEQRRQLFKKDNAVIFGIPESDDGKQLFDELMKILLPRGMDGILTHRIGPPTKKDRPIVVRTGNSNIKQTMFSNLPKLKDLDKFRSVNVSHDYTSQQRIAKANLRLKSKDEAKKAEAKKAAAEKADAMKEKSNENTTEASSDDDNEGDQPPPKKSRIDNKKADTGENMET